MAGFGLLGHLAGGYAQAAKEDRARQDAFDEHQRELSTGLGSMLLQNPAVPPEYKGPIAQLVLQTAQTKRGGKMPSWDKLFQSLPATNTPAKVSNVQQPELTLRPPSIPPGAPQASAAPAAGPSGDTSPAVGGLSAPMMSNIGPGNASGIAPPAIPPGPMPTMTIPGATGTATQAPQPVAPAGHFHIMSPEEMAQREQTIQMNRAQEISRQTGVPVERVLGLQPKFVGIPWGGGVLNQQTGEIESPATPKPIGAPEKLPDQSGTWHLYQRYQDGKLHMIPDIAGVVIPPPPGWAATVKTGQYHYVDNDGNVRETPTSSTTQKVIPGVNGAAPKGGTMPTGGAGSVPSQGGPRIISGSAPKQSPAQLRTDRSYTSISGQMDKIQSPIDQLASRMSRLTDTLDQKNPQADALVAPELLTVMAGGQGSGLRMNEAEIARIVGGRSKWEDLKASINKWKTDPEAARSITPDQDRMIRALVDTVRQKVDSKRAILEQARTDLLNAKTPEEHRKVYSDARNKILAVDTGAQVASPGQPPTAQSQQHVIELNGKHYQYKGSGDTADIKNYSEVTPQ